MRPWLCSIVQSIRSALLFLAIEIGGRLLYATGFLYLIGSLRQRYGRRRLLIPMYHRVRGESAEDGTALLDLQRGVGADLFEKHLRVFKWFGPLLTLEEAFDHLHDPTRPSRTAVAVTFDDGYRDNVEIAVPALLRHGGKATIFPVVRTASGGRPLWWDELTDTLCGGVIDGGHFLSPQNGGLTGQHLFRVQPEMAREAAAELLCERLVELPSERRETMLNEFARGAVRCARNTSGRLYATWDELRSAAAVGMEIGGHTVDHVVLPCERVEVAQTQIAESRAVLQQEIGSGIRSFAYPNGRHDAAVRSLVAEAGFRLAVTVRHGVNDARTDPYQLRRIPVFQERPFHLALKLAFYDFAHRG